MKDIKWLLKEKANLETVMQRGLETSVRAFAQQELDKVCKQIKEACEEWDRLFEQQEIDLLKQRVSELEHQVQEYKEENVKLLQTLLSLYRAVKKANCNLDAIEEKCDNNVWFQRLKERMY